MRYASVIIVISLVSSAVAFDPPAVEADWRVVNESALTAEQSQSKNSAIAARDALFERLTARLSAVVDAEGPAAAIAVCQAEAPAIAKAVAAERNVRIGRTSLKLRNQANRPPSWVDPLLAKPPTEPTFLSGPDGQFGALLPIRLKAQCLTCHGPVRSMPVEVRTALAQRYPNDRAVGYAEGDLRGWFWVEVPR